MYGLRRLRRSRGVVCWFRLLSWGLVLPWCGAVFADPSADYYRICVDGPYDYAASAPHLTTRVEFNERVTEGRRRAEVSCPSFIAGLAELPNPTPEERLALFRASWTSQDGDYCTAATPFVQSLPAGNPDALMIRSVCTADRKESLALLLRSLEADPRHPRHGAGLRHLYQKVWRGGAEVDAETLLRHWNTRYEITRSPRGKLEAAALTYVTAVEAGEQGAAKDIRARARKDLRLDDMEFERREAALELVCDQAILDLDLEQLCTEAVERLASEAAALGDHLPPDILRPLEGAIRLIAGTRLIIGGGGGPEEREALARLRTVLEGYPGHLKSSEHLRVYAGALPEGPGRTGALRSATNLDPGNLAARCGLAESLERTSPEEAWSIYTELAARSTDLPWHCNPEVSLQRLENRAATGRPENEVEEIFLHF